MASNNRRNSPRLVSVAVEASEYLSSLGAIVDVVKAMVPILLQADIQGVSGISSYCDAICESLCITEVAQ